MDEYLLCLFLRLLIKIILISVQTPTYHIPSVTTYIGVHIRNTVVRKVQVILSPTQPTPILNQYSRDDDRVRDCKTYHCTTKCEI